MSSKTGIDRMQSRFDVVAFLLRTVVGTLLVRIGDEVDGVVGMYSAVDVWRNNLLGSQWD